MLAFFKLNTDFIRNYMGGKCLYIIIAILFFSKIDLKNRRQ